jgi:raffinose synthase
MQLVMRAGRLINVGISQPASRQESAVWAGLGSVWGPGGEERGRWRKAETTRSLRGPGGRLRGVGVGVGVALSLMYSLETDDAADSPSIYSRARERRARASPSGFLGRLWEWLKEIPRACWRSTRRTESRLCLLAQPAEHSDDADADSTRSAEMRIQVRIGPERLLALSHARALGDELMSIKPVDLPPSVVDQSVGVVKLQFTLPKLAPRSSVEWILGRLPGNDIVALSRFKLWWMRPNHCRSCMWVPHETQLLLSRQKGEGEGDWYYTLLVPLLHGQVRSHIRGVALLNSLALVAETGDSATPVHTDLLGAVLAVGRDPFSLLEAGMAVVRKHHGGAMDGSIGSPPAFIDSFGWCTWDSFYTGVDHEKVMEGLQSLQKAGVSPKWLVLDDGWQSVAHPNAPNGKQWYDRLTDIRSNDKFASLRMTVKEAKERYGVKHFIVWHAIQGYWQGIQPGTPALSRFEPQLSMMHIPPGISEIDPDMRLVARLGLIIKRLQFLRRRYCFGLIPPRTIEEFYTAYHEYLKEEGVDGVKVDAQSVLGCLGGGVGGGVHLNRATHAALSSSVHTHFSSEAAPLTPSSNLTSSSPSQSSTAPSIIHCMCHDSSILLQLPKHYKRGGIPVVRGSDDFYPRDSASHGTHLYANAFNALFLGHSGGWQDWDMFQTSIEAPAWSPDLDSTRKTYQASSMHAAARAVSGGPIYVSDRPGHHNVELLRKLVLADGTIARCSKVAMPTLDCLFADPQHDRRRPLLSIWNVNAVDGHGVVGSFNIYGSRWVQKKRAYGWVHGFMREKMEADEAHSAASYLAEALPAHPSRKHPHEVEASVCPADCHTLTRQYSEPHRKFVTYLHNASRLHMGSLRQKVSAGWLGTYDFEVASIAVVHSLECGVEWGCIGLRHMYNAGGCIVSEAIESNSVTLVIRGAGALLAYSSVLPTAVTLDGRAAEFRLGTGSSGDGDHNIETEVCQMWVLLPTPYLGVPRICNLQW